MKAVYYVRSMYGVCSYSTGTLAHSTRVHSEDRAPYPPTPILVPTTLVWHGLNLNRKVYLSPPVAVDPPTPPIIYLHQVP